MENNQVNVGVLGTADIAFRRFIPALLKTDKFHYVGVASRDINKTERFIESFGGKGYSSYEELLADSNIDAVYIPLPPALHYFWGKKALESGKHVFMEKPFCTKNTDVEDLCRLASEKNLCIYENYMFIFHKQLVKIRELIMNYTIGKLRLARIAFGFPKRSAHDFRYNKSLGGGALLDCGGYTVKLATYLLGASIKLDYCNLINDGQEVDMYGNATFSSDDSLTAQVAFGMDNSYKCQLELWGEKSILKAERIFTAPDNFDVVLSIENNGETQEVFVGKDDQFLNSILYFRDLINDKTSAENEIQNILCQSKLIEAMINSHQEGNDNEC